MRKLTTLLFVTLLVGGYLHYVQGWDLTRVKRSAVGRVIWKDDASATTTPIGSRGVGTHWEAVAPMPRPRGDFGAALIGERIYAVGGSDGYGRTLRSMDVYDVPTDTWSEGPLMPEARHHPAVTTDGEKLYVVGGFVGLAFRPVDTVFVFDPAIGTWDELGRMNDFRGGAAAVVHEGRIYVTGGTTLEGVASTLEYYDAKRGGWNGLRVMPTSRDRLAGVVLGGDLYFIGGRKRSLATNMSTLERFDPDSGNQDWKQLADMPTARSGHAAAAQGGKLYVFGGEGKEGTIASVEAYDPKQDAWTTLETPLPSPRHGMAAVPYQDRIYVLGGGRRAGFSVSDLHEVLILETKKK